MPSNAARSRNPSLPRLPQLRRDAAVLAVRGGVLHLALSARQVLSVANASPELVHWLLLLDGTMHLDDALACAPVSDAEARYLLAELDRGGFLAEANEGLLFRRSETAQHDALRLAQQTRAGASRATGGRPARAQLTVGLAGEQGWTQALGRALALPGLRVQQAAARADLLLVIGDALDPKAQEAGAAALAGGTPHVSVAVSAVDAVMLPLTVPGRTACRRCWALQRDNRVPDWSAWIYAGRQPDPPTLPSHHRALVLALVVEHLLCAVPAVRNPHDPAALAAASVERYLDLRRATVTVEPIRSHPACGCIPRAA